MAVDTVFENNVVSLPSVIGRSLQRCGRALLCIQRRRGLRWWLWHPPFRFGGVGPPEVCNRNTAWGSKCRGTIEKAKEGTIENVRYTIENDSCQKPCHETKRSNQVQAKGRSSTIHPSPATNEKKSQAGPGRVVGSVFKAGLNKGKDTHSSPFPSMLLR